MTDEMIALGRRAVACKGFRWLPGMRAVGQYPDYPVRVHAFGENLRDTDDMEQPEPWGWQQPAPYGDHVYPGPYLPDLTDPATLGCLLVLVRDAYADARITVVPRGARVWAVVYPGWLHMKAIAMGKTEAEALVAALEAAP
jgi:hypothetical protein